MVAQLELQSTTRREADRFLHELEAHVSVAVKELAGADEALAGKIGNVVAARLSAVLGGQSFHLSKAHALLARNQLIYAAWRGGAGGNFQQLAKQYGLSERHVRYIVEQYGERRGQQGD